jgi:hypothetical protein
MPEKFRRLFEGPDEIDYTPDPMGRIGEGAREIRDPAVDDEGQQLFQDFRNAWAERRALPDLFGTKGTLDLKDGIGLQARNRRPDVAKVETFLDLLGAHDAAPTEGPTGYYSMRLEDNLKAFQAKNGLTVDGTVKPLGETLGRIKQDLTRKLGPAALKPPRPKPPRKAGTPSGTAPRSLQSEVLKGPLDGADLPKPPDGGAMLIPVQAAGGPPAIGRKPPPTHRQAERHSEQKLRKAIAGLDALEAKYRTFLDRAKIANRASREVRGAAPHLSSFTIKIDNAIKAYERYLDSTGGTVDYDPRWMLQHEMVRQGEAKVHKHFRDWMIGARRSDRLTERFFQRMLRLKENQSITARDFWEGKIRFRREHRFDDHRLLIRSSNVRGDGTLTFTRKGNFIEVTGINRFPFGERLVHNDMLWLQSNGRAKPFVVRSVWRRKVVARIRIAKDLNTGETRIVGFASKPRWSDIE